MHNRIGSVLLIQPAKYRLPHTFLTIFISAIYKLLFRCCIAQILEFYMFDIYSMISLSHSESFSFKLLDVFIMLSLLTSGQLTTTPSLNAGKDS